jgi:hypothetical protein
MDRLGGGKADRYASQHRQRQFVVRLHLLILLGSGLRTTHLTLPFVSGRACDEVQPTMANSNRGRDFTMLPT